MTHHKQVDRRAVAHVLLTAASEALQASERWHHLIMTPGVEFNSNLPTEGQMLAVVSVKALERLSVHFPDASSQQLSIIIWHLMELVEEVHLGWPSYATVEELCHADGAPDWGGAMVGWLGKAADRCLQKMADELAQSDLVLVGGTNGAAWEAS